MPTREVLSPSQRAQFIDIPDAIGERELARYYTLSPDELTVIEQRRRPHNRLGFAVQLCYLRFPGRPLCADEQVPEPVLAYIAAHLGLDPAVMRDYAQERDTTRREHLGEIQRTFGFCPFDAQSYRALAVWLLPTALGTDSGVALVTALVEEMRGRKVVAPALYLIERLAWETRRRAQRQVSQRLTTGIMPPDHARLDALLTVAPGRRQTPLVWLRQPPGKPSPPTILALIERLTVIRVLGLDHTLARQVHQNRLLQLAREGGRYSPAFLARFEPTRRYATLVAFLIETAATLTDQILAMHDRLMTGYLHRSEQAHAAQFHASGKAINEKVRLYAAVGTAVIAARADDGDPYRAIQAVLPWESFVQTVAEATHLARPADFGYLDHLDAFYGQVRRYAPALLDALEFRGAPPCRPLLRALQALKELNAADARKVPQGVPTAFVKPRWADHVFTDTGIDRHYYELCALHELRNGLRSGDIWVAGSRQFKAFEDYLLPDDAWQGLKDAGPLPLAIPTDVTTYLAQRRQDLHDQLTTVAALMAADDLPDVRLRKGKLSITPLPKAVPDAAEDLAERAYARMPWVKITDLLVAVDGLTDFSRHFTHLHTGAPPRDKAALFAAILADATNLGLSKMANACPGLTFARLSWVSDWSLRDETMRRPWVSSSTTTTACRLPHTGAMGRPPPRTPSASRSVAGARPRPRSTPDMDTSPASCSTPISPTSTPRSTSRPSARRRTRRPTCLMGCSTTRPTSRSRNTTRIPAVCRTICSGCAPRWASASPRASATSLIDACTRWSRPRRTRRSPRSSVATSTSSASRRTGTTCCACSPPFASAR